MYVSKEMERKGWNWVLWVGFIRGREEEEEEEEDKLKKKRSSIYVYFVC